MGVANQVNRHSKSPYTTIAASGQTSGAVNFDEYAFGLFYTPSAFTSTSVTFTVSYDGTTYVALKDSSGTAISRTVTTSSAYPLPDELAGCLSFKIVAGSAEAAARTIYFSLKG